MIYSCSVHILCITTHHMVENIIIETISSVFRHLFHDYAPKNFSTYPAAFRRTSNNERLDIEPASI